MKNHFTVGVVGLAGCGKTVFLTSLIAHLKDHEPDLFHLHSFKHSLDPRAIIGKFRKPTDSEVIVKKFRHIPSAAIEEDFPYERFRDALVNHGRWPEKTKDLNTYHMCFERTDRIREIDITLIDFPGERIADAMMGNSDYVQWSDDLLLRYDNDSDYRTLCEDYLNYINGKTVVEEEVISRFKIVLGRLMAAYKPLITPSIFSLDLNGKTPSAAPPEELARKRIVGLAEDSQFAPLSAQCRAQNPEIAERFSAHYQAYRTHVPDRVFKKLHDCDGLIVAIDVPGTLRANIGRLNDTEAILDSLFQICAPDTKAKSNRIMERVRSKSFSLLRMPFVLPMAWLPIKLKRIAFVATKSDLVQYEQATRMRDLLSQIVQKKMRNFDFKWQLFTCSAITSTFERDGKLFGYPIYDVNCNLLPPPAADTALSELKPDDLPKEWPTDWGNNQYYFPEVWPVLPRRKTQPPKQEGLNKIIDFLLA